ncbi:MAG: hypothetical protein KY461_09335, partial [Actinobacteria bacterium]|nr:hypothetical protein [Actinomycetota bacterium]
MAGVDVGSSTPQGAASAGAQVLDLAAHDAALRSDELAELVELGRDRGFVTTIEITEAVALTGHGDDHVPIFTRALKRAGVAVVEMSDGDGRGEASAVLATTSVDPVRLYL